MAYVLLGSLGVGVCAGVWRAWRRRYPLTTLRIVLVTALAVGTGVGLWALHEVEGAAAAGRAVGDGFANIRVH